MRRNPKPYELSTNLPELLEHAQRIGERAAREAPQTDKRGRLSDELMADMVSSGLIGVLQPKRFGGLELGFPEFVRIGEIIASHDVSAGWVYCILGAHHWWGALAEPAFQQELWGNDPHRMFADVFAPTGKVEHSADGLVLSGSWKFASGVLWADYVCLGAMGSYAPGEAPEYLMLFVPKADLQVLDDWDTMGLRGTASCGVTVERALVEPRLQDELWKDDHHRIFTDVFAPVGKVHMDGDNYIVSGKWSFASGSPFGTYCAVGAMAPWEPGAEPEYLMLFLAPGDYQILDDWDTVGLRGSASCSILADRAVVPKYRAMRLGRFVATGEAPGHAYNNAGIYHVPFGIALTGALLAPGMGGARGVLKAFRERMRERTPLFAAQNQAGQVSSQLLLAELTARTDAAEQLYLHYADEADALALRIARGEPTGDLLEMRARMFGWRAHIAHECRAVGNEVFQHAGAFAIYKSAPIQRFWRDLYAMGQHIAVNHETGMLAFGRSLVGLEPEAVLF